MVNSAIAPKTRDLSRIGALDYILMTVGCCLAGFSGGMSLNESRISWFVVQGILFGSLFSFLVRSLVKRRHFLKIDGVLYGIIVVISFAARGPLQTLMPEGGFPIEVMAAGGLSWMLIMGSFVTWQDSTLLFQAVPSIAMFGLVGCYDTFRNVIYLFFAFLLCLATLFARAHYRQMLRQAADSGYFTRGLAPGTPVPEVETTPGLALQMQEGPWRWVAGPEWALGSALVVVLISLLGAPVIQRSTQGVAGFVHVPTPPQRNRTTPTALFNQSYDGAVKIGQGPNRLTNRPMLEVQMPQMHYLRATTYDTYRQGTWQWTEFRGIGTDANAAALSELYEGNEAVKFDFEVRLRVPMRYLPVPGTVVGWTNRPPSPQRGDGSFEVSTVDSNRVYSGTAAESAPKVRPARAQTNLPTNYANMLDLDGVPASVIELARSVAGDGSDYQKAEHIRTEISRRIKYNLKAAAVPGGRDPVEYTLFERPESYCDIYASTMVLMARSVGIPARYVTGYLPSEDSVDAQGRYVVLESDAHAWAELYFEKVGWVIFDATSGADSVPGGERGQTTENGPWYQQRWFKSALDASMVVIIGGAVIIFLRAVASRQRRRTARGDLDKVYIAYSRTLEGFARVRRDPSQTPDEFLALVIGHLGTAGPIATEINDRFISLMYSPGEVSNQDVAGLWLDVRALKKALRLVPAVKR